MGWETEILYPASCIQTSNWFVEPDGSAKWSLEENKRFERALAIHDQDTADRWQRVADMIPGKTVDEVRMHYRDLEVDVSQIEAGLVPVPGYSWSSFRLDWTDSRGFDGLKQRYSAAGKRTGSGRADHERKKGVPWTEEEHRLFLIGLKKYGKGYWRNISRYYVTSRTSTQVASHAQKYFIRLSSGGKDKRRSSIHDITTVNLPEDKPPPPPPPPRSPAPSSIRLTPPPQARQLLAITGNIMSQHKATTTSSNAAMASEASGNIFAQPSHDIMSSYRRYPYCWAPECAVSDAVYSL